MTGFSFFMALGYPYTKITAAIILSKSPINSVNNNAYYSQLYIIMSILEQPKQTLFRP